MKKGHVLGIDVDIRKHNKKEIENHPMYKRITMVEGSSIEEKTLKLVNKFSKKYKKILVCLDSNHTHKHVLEELNSYSKFVSKGSYIIVLDTIIDDMPKKFYDEVIQRPWGKGNNPKTAIREFLKKNKRFQIDEEYEKKLMMTVAPSGFLKCIKT